MHHLVESMEHHGHLDLDPEVRGRLLAASAATLDRLLKLVRVTVVGRCPASTIFADSCCLIEKCYRNFSTWDRSTPRPALIPALQRSSAMGSPAVV